MSFVFALFILKNYINITIHVAFFLKILWHLIYKCRFKVSEV